MSADYPLLRSLCKCPGRILDPRLIECAECGDELPPFTDSEKKIMLTEAKRHVVGVFGPAWAKAAIAMFPDSPPQSEDDKMAQSDSDAQASISVLPRSGSNPLRYVPPSNQALHVAWVDRAGGVILGSDGSRKKIAKNCTLAVMLDALPSNVTRVFMVGKMPGGVPSKFATWLSSPIPDGWTYGNQWAKGNRPVGRYGQAQRKIEVHTAGVWWSSGTVDDAKASWDQLTQAIGGCFKGATPRTTPAATGRMLLRSSWPYGTGEWDDLPADIQAIIRRNTTQPRREFFGTKRHAEHIYEIDGRFMYAAFLREIAHAPATHLAGVNVTQNDFAKGGDFYYRAGLYHVQFVVPEQWDHIGILPWRCDKNIAHECDGTSWHWPATPGFVGETWCDSSELQLAINNPREIPWSFNVIEAYLYDRREGQGRTGPLQQWGHQLTKIEADLHDKAPEVAAMVRSIVRHTIGSLSPSPHVAERRTSIENAE